MSVGESTVRLVYRNPLDLPRISYADIAANTAEGVYVEQPGTARRFLRAPPVFHDDPDDAGLFPSFHNHLVTYPPVFTVSLRDATLVGFRSILSCEGFFVNDLGHLSPEDVRSFAQGLTTYNELTNFVPTSDDAVFAHATNGRSELHLEGPVVLLTSAEAGNFGSFIFRELPKLVTLPEMPVNWRFLIDVPSETYEQFLNLVGLPTERVIRQDPRTIYHIDQAIIPGLRNPLALADPQTRALYERLRAKFDSGTYGRLVYVSRHSISAAKQTGRVMLNEGELIDRLRPLGFDIVEPQHLTAAEQVAAFASADMVVGPSGSGMFNAVFCRPGTKLIDIESEPHWCLPHSCLFASAGLRYGIFEGLAANRDWSVHHKPWNVNIEALLERIAAFMPTKGVAMPGTLAVDKSSNDITPFWRVPDLAGENYVTVLQRFHQTFRPKNYLEVGVSNGETLRLASCSSIGVDPNFQIERPVLIGKPMCCFYQMTSDKFFENFDPSAIFGRPLEMAFLDGMHWFEFLLRDFINTEKYCKPNSIVFLHDCIPTDEYVSRRKEDDHRLQSRTAHPGWWAGDVWKILAILMAFRPDLQIVAFDAEPTGLIAVTRLDPTSTILADRYFDLVREYKDRTLAEQGNSYHASLRVVDTRHYASVEALSKLFWL